MFITRVIQHWAWRNLFGLFSPPMVWSYDHTCFGGWKKSYFFPYNLLMESPPSYVKNAFGFRRFSFTISLFSNVKTKNRQVWRVEVRVKLWKTTKNPRTCIQVIRPFERPETPNLKSNARFCGVNTCAPEMLAKVVLFFFFQKSS